VPQWTPDSKKVLIKALPKELTIEDAANMVVAAPQKSPATESVSSVLVYASSAMTNEKDAAHASAHKPPFNITLNRYLSDLTFLDVTTGEVQRLAIRCNPVAYFLSPDGKNAAFSNLKGFEWDSQVTLYDIIVVSAADARQRVIASNVKMSYGRNVSWSPDGESVCYITSGPLAKGDCYVVSVATGESRNLTEPPHPNFGVNHYSQPLWDAAGQHIYTIGKNNLWVVPVTSGKPTQLTRALNRDVLEIVAPNRNGRFWSPDNGKSAYVCTRDNKSKRRSKPSTIPPLKSSSARNRILISVLSGSRFSR
jgi:hypothetical protein